MALFTSDWTPTRDGRFFRRQELYSMAWSESSWTDSMRVCAAHEGGPILVCRDISNQSSPLSTYTASGILMGITKTRGLFRGFGWSHEQEAIVVDSQGQISIYDMFLEDFETVSMSQEVRKSSVLEAQVFASHQGTGVAVLCANNRLYMITSLKRQTTLKLPEIPGGSSAPSCWIAAADRRRSFAIVAKELDIFLVETDSKPQPLCCVGQRLSTAQCYIQLCLDVTGTRLAALTDSGHVMLTQLDDPASVRIIDTELVHVISAQLKWCGSVAVAVCGSGTSLLHLCLADSSEVVTFPLDSACHMCAESDNCVRIISRFSHELVETVSDSSISVLNIGSMAPSAVLLEAYREYQKSSHKADEYVRMVDSQLSDSVTTCIEAASDQNNVELQQLLLRAALYGRCFLVQSDPHLYISTCRYLRVLNSLRHPDCGIPLTYQQLRALPVRELLSRLCRRRLHFLAVRVCQLLLLPPSGGAVNVLQNWAEHTVCTASVSQTATVRQISSVLSAESLSELRRAAGANCGVSLANVARVAQQNGKTDAAKALLELEPSAERKVPLLIELGEGDIALQQAAASCDPQLLYTALLQLQQLQQSAAAPRVSFQMLLHNYPVAQTMFAKYLRERGKSERLLDLMIQEDDYCGQARQQLIDAAKQQRPDLQTPYLAAASELFRKGKQEFLANEVANQSRLIKYQLSLEESCSEQFVGLPLVCTIKRLLALGKHKLADGLKSDFKLSEKRWWHIKLTAYAESALWLEMEKLSKAKKSPIGYEPFVDICLDYKQLAEARKYVSKVRDENKIKYLCLVGDLEGAARVAVERRDLSDLAHVEAQCGPGQQQLLTKIHELRHTLRR